MRAPRLTRSALLLAGVAMLPVVGRADPPPAPSAAVREYRARREGGAEVVRRVTGAFGRPFSAFTEDDYAAFLDGIDLDGVEGLWTWSLVTGIPVFALDRGSEFLAVNAHLLEEAEAARALRAEELRGMRTRIRDGRLTVTAASGEALAVRPDADASLRALGSTGQIRHNRDFAGDETAPETLRTCLVPLEEVPYLGEVGEALRVLPLSLVKVLHGKALYLVTRGGGRATAVWHCTGSDLDAGFAGLQPGVVVEAGAEGRAAEHIVRGLCRLVRETVLESQYFGVYAYPYRFPAFQRLQPARRRIFGRRRDRLLPTAHGYVTERARADAQANFVEHLAAYLLDREAFRRRAEAQAAAGHPELSRKYALVRTLVEETPPTMERLTAEHLGQFDPEEREAILEEYRARAAEGPAVCARVETEFGKPFASFTPEDYARFLAGLDLDDDDDLWTWSHVAGIPVVGIDKRSNFFHQNAHLLADVEAANRMSWHDLHDLVTEYDRETGAVTIRSRATGVRHAVRDLPPGTVRHLQTAGSLRPNEGWAEDRITYEALAYCLVRLADLENRSDLVEAIRMLPLSMVHAHRGKAIYPTTRSRTGWAFTWRVGTEDNPSYVGMIPGSLVECRRDGARARVPPEALVAHGLDSLVGSSTDSALHEIGHVIDLNVIGARGDSDAHPYQFPAMRALVDERHALFALTPDTETGYVSGYATVNAQENFAEHFWAYLRAPADFLARARREAEAGRDLLLRKYRFMEELVEETPATAWRLSPAYLEWREAELRRERERERAVRVVRQREVLAEYQAWYAERDEVVARVQARFGKPFPAFTREDYATWMEELDLNRDEDLWAWSHVTGIPVLALCRTSSFFRGNTHLLADVEAAKRMGARESYALRTEVDPDSGAPIVRDPAGQALALRDLPAGVLRRTARTHGFWHFEDFGEARTLPEVLAPYLLPFGDLAYREAIDGWLRSLPLSVVQVYRGKGIYFTTVAGRSFAPTMPASNTTYRLHAGMQTGLWVEMRRGGVAGTGQNFVHEFGHILDYVVLQGGYGGYRAPHQFPGFRAALPEKEDVFGRRDDPVPPTPHGYVSRYARTNAQESFAEHFRAFVTERDAFRRQAEAEEAEGHPELMEKYRFMERLLEHTPTTLRRLSPELLALDARWTATRERLARLYRARRLLGTEAPDALGRWIETLRATALRETAPDAEAVEAALRREVIADLRSRSDAEAADAALVAVLGLSLELRADRGATSASPSFTAVVRGADEGTVTGTVRLDTRVPSRFDPPPATPFELATGATHRIAWVPNTGDDLSAFVAVAVADLVWEGRRLGLERELPCRPSIPVWNVIGPFPNPGGAVGDVPHPPEAEVDLAAAYEVPGGGRVAWRPVRRPAEAKLDAEFVVDLAEALGPEEDVAGYAVVWAYVPEAVDAELAIGSADGVVAWVNGERVFAWLEGRRDYRSRADRVPVRLRPGANEILLKVTRASRAWRLGAHLTAPGAGPLEGLRFALEP